MTGPLALVGSGEFLDDMTEIDRTLLADATRPCGPVVIVPTAAALEPGKPEEWADSGIRHFLKRLSVSAEPAFVLDRASADERYVSLVQSARLIYFSGGNPRYLVETMSDTPFWEAVRTAWRDGAALAGCSAGAMLMGASIQNIVGRAGEPIHGMGILAGMAVIPHFDRIEHYRPGEVDAVRRSRIPGTLLLGIDERTALIHSVRGWQVQGAGSVSVMRETKEQTFRAGESLNLPAPLA
ncbi:MAG TPA: Type 1 glutamine amidotransferase-like domain-containing protein [Dehalococcoidia bacterium]